MRIKIEMSIVPSDPSGDHRFFATIDEVENEAVLELEIEKTDADLVCHAVTIRKQKGVVSRDLRIPLEHYLDLVATHPVLRDHRGAILEKKRRRRDLDDEFLGVVVAAYMASGCTIDGLTPDIDDRFYASTSTKYRWLKVARDRGLLEPAPVIGSAVE